MMGTRVGGNKRAWGHAQMRDFLGWLGEVSECLSGKLSG
jgi:hypothetical protein